MCGDEELIRDCKHVLMRADNTHGDIDHGVLLERAMAEKIDTIQRYGDSETVALEGALATSAARVGVKMGLNIVFRIDTISA